MSDNIEGLPEGATVRPLRAPADQIEGLPEGATVRPLPNSSTAHPAATGASTESQQHPAGWRAPITKQEQPGLLDRADKAVTDTLATNPDNLKSATRTNLIEVPKTLGREVYSGTKTALGLIPGVYHAFADEATPEEKARYAESEKENGEAPGTETSGYKRIGLGLGRISGVPSAIEAAKDYASGRVGYNDILENAPEALGQGAGTVVGGKLIEDVGGKAVKAAKDIDPKELITAPVRLGARTTESVLNQKIAPIKPILKIMTPADTADAVQIRVPGRDFGLAEKGSAPKEPGYAGPQYTEATPAKPTGPLAPKGRIPYPSEETPVLIPEEGLVGPEHAEGTRGELIPAESLPPKTRAGYAPMETGEAPTEPGLVGSEHAEGTPAEPTGELAPKARVGYPAIEETTPSAEPEQLIPEESKPGNVRSLRAKGGKVIDTDPNDLQPLLQESLNATKKATGYGKIGEAPAAGSDLSNTLIDTEKSVKPAVEAAKGESSTRNPEAADAESLVREQVNALRDQDLIRLAKAHDIDHADYDLSKRDANRHRVERDQLAKDIVSKMSDDEVQNLNRAAENIQHNPDASGTSKAERAKRIFPRLRGPVDEFGNPKISGASQGYEGTERRATDRSAPLSATELEAAMKLRQPVRTPFDDTEGARATIQKDLASRGLGSVRGESAGVPKSEYDELINAALEKVPESKTPAPRTENNASSESAASQEALNRTASEKSKGTKYFRLDTRKGKAMPLIGPDRVDATAGDYDEIVRVEKDGTESVLDRGSKAIPRLRSSKLFNQ